MTDFRLVRRLHAYSGGTVPDFDRISYSPSILHATDGTQAFMNLCRNYTLSGRLCQEHLWYASSKYMPLDIATAVNTLENRH